jgi:putative addiction module component (TIGR02574 family)
MSLDSESIFNAALELSDDQRMALVLRLMDTIPDQGGTTSLNDAELVREIERRFADQAESIPWSELRAEG